MHQTLILIVLAAFLSGCAFGQKHDYREVPLALSASGAGTLAIAVHDQRPDVVSGEEKPSYAGLQRGGYGNAFDVMTKSGKPIADDWSGTISAALKSKGFDTAPVSTTPAQDRAGVLASLSGRRALLITMNAWYADTYTDTTVHHDLVAEVLDGAGRSTAMSRSHGATELDGSFMNPTGAARTNVRDFFRLEIEKLLNDPGIVGALR